MTFKEDDCLGVGYVINHKELFFLPDEGRVSEWSPLSLELREGDFPDYLASDMGCRMCSEKLKGILEQSKSISDDLQWLDVFVNKDQQIRNYSILHFPTPPDVLNKKKSIFAGSFVVKPVLDRNLVGKNQIFGYPNCGKLPLFVSDGVRMEIESNNCSGIQFDKAPIF